MRHQYELLYFSGALFCAFYMLTCLDFQLPQAKKADEPLKDSENFYEGFEEPDLSVVSDSEQDH